MLRALAVAVGACVFAAVAAGATSANGVDGVDDLPARMDGLWTRRAAPGAMQELVALGTDGAQSYEVEWRLARAYFWVANTQSNRAVKKAMAGKAIESAERARTLRPERVEGHYFYAVAVGEYASTVGVVQAVMDGAAGKLESAALRAYAIDRDYYDGAPATVLGRYYFMLPWPKHDAKRSRHYLEEVVARHPRALIARCYLADTYHELGEDEKARAQLAFVLAHDPPPDTELDAPQPKALAQEAMQRWFPGAAVPDGEAGR